MKYVKKAIIPIAGLGTRFLPLSKVIPKEFFPLNSKPVIQHIIEEALESGVTEFIFVISPEKKKIFTDYILKYFQEEAGELMKILKRRKKNEAVKTLKLIPKIKYKYVVQKKPLGDGDAILRTEKLVKKEPFLVLFGDDISCGKETMASQLINSFAKTKSPVLCLYRMPREKLHVYGVPKVEKADKFLYKVTDLIEKPKKNPPSNFAVVGKYVLTHNIFHYLRKTKKENGEIMLLNALRELIKDGKALYGVEAKAKWLECGSKEKWLDSFMYITKKG